MKLEEEQLKAILYKLNKKINIENKIKKNILIGGAIGLSFSIYMSNISIINMLVGSGIGGGIGYMYNKYIYL